MKQQNAANTDSRNMSQKVLQPAEFAERMTPFLEELLAKAGFRLTFQLHQIEHRADPEDPDIVVDFSGPDTEYLLAYKGELLKALEHLVLEVLHVSQEQRERVLFDCQDYRALRMEELRMAAQAAAEKVRRTGAPYPFAPMNSRERRIVHMALRDQPDIRSESEGVGSARHVVVRPAQEQQASAQHPKPHPPSR
jgi:spoIIIJ-associated protein